MAPRRGSIVHLGYEVLAHLSYRAIDNRREFRSVALPVRDLAIAQDAPPELAEEDIEGWPVLGVPL
jgi:hypothetical protein